MTYAPVKIEFAETFKRKNATQPGPWLGADGHWCFTVYAMYGSADYRNHVFRWKPGMKAEHVDLQTETTARGDIGVHSLGAASFSWDDTQDYPCLWVQEVPGLAPAPLDPRVSLLLDRIAALEQRIAAMEQGGGLSDDDRASLDWVWEVRALG